MNGVRPSYGCRSGLGEPEIADLALLDQPGHRSDGLLDRRFGIDAVLIIQIDRLDVQPLQTGLAGLHHVLGSPAHAHRLAAGRTHVSELRGQRHLVTPVTDGPPHQLLVPPHTIHIGGIEKRYAKLQSSVNGGN